MPFPRPQLTSAESVNRTLSATPSIRLPGSSLPSGDPRSFTGRPAGQGNLRLNPIIGPACPKQLLCSSLQEYGYGLNLPFSHCLYSDELCCSSTAARQQLTRYTTLYQRLHIECNLLNILLFRRTARRVVINYDSCALYDHL